MKKFRFLSLILAFVLVFTSIDVSAYAASAENDVVSETEAADPSETALDDINSDEVVPEKPQDAIEAEEVENNEEELVSDSAADVWTIVDTTSNVVIGNETGFYIDPIKSTTTFALKKNGVQVTTAEYTVTAYDSCKSFVTVTADSSNNILVKVDPSKVRESNSYIDRVNVCLNIKDLNTSASDLGQFIFADRLGYFYLNGSVIGIYPHIDSGANDINLVSSSSGYMMNGLNSSVYGGGELPVGAITGTTLTSENTGVIQATPSQYGSYVLTTVSEGEALLNYNIQYKKADGTIGTYSTKIGFNVTLPTVEVGKDGAVGGFYDEYVYDPYNGGYPIIASVGSTSNTMTYLSSTVELVDAHLYVDGQAETINKSNVKLSKDYSDDSSTHSVGINFGTIQKPEGKNTASISGDYTIKDSNNRIVKIVIPAQTVSFATSPKIDGKNVVKMYSGSAIVKAPNATGNQTLDQGLSASFISQVGATKGLKAEKVEIYDSDGVKVGEFLNPTTSVRSYAYVNNLSSYADTIKGAPIALNDLADSLQNSDFTSAKIHWEEEITESQYLSLRITLNNANAPIFVLENYFYALKGNDKVAGSAFVAYDKFTRQDSSSDYIGVTIYGRNLTKASAPKLYWNAEETQNETVAASFDSADSGCEFFHTDGDENYFTYVLKKSNKSDAKWNSNYTYAGFDADQNVALLSNDERLTVYSNRGNDGISQTEVLSDRLRVFFDSSYADVGDEAEIYVNKNGYWDSNATFPVDSFVLDDTGMPLCYEKLEVQSNDNGNYIDVLLSSNEAKDYKKLGFSGILVFAFEPLVNSSTIYYSSEKMSGYHGGVDVKDSYLDGGAISTSAGQTIKIYNILGELVYTKTGPDTLSVDKIKDFAATGDLYKVCIFEGDNQVGSNVYKFSSSVNTISFNLNETGLEGDAATLLGNATIIATNGQAICAGGGIPSAKKPGYKFAGWYANSACTGTALNGSQKANFSSDVTFYAKWIPITYTIKFASGVSGASGSMSDMKVSYGVDSPVITNKFSSKGRAFKGWRITDSEGNVINITGDAVVNGFLQDGATVRSLAKTEGAVVTFTAQWETANYSISYVLNGGQFDDEENVTTTYTINDEVVLPTLSDNGKVVAPAGTTFAGWYTDAAYKTAVPKNTSGAQAIKSGSTGNVTLYAKWVPGKYQIEFDTNWDDSMAQTDIKGTMAPLTALAGADTKLPKNTYKAVDSINQKTERYVFLGWTLDDVSANCDISGLSTFFKNESIVTSDELSLSGADISDALANDDVATVTLHAVWANEYIINLDAGSGYTFNLTKLGTYKEGGTVNDYTGSINKISDQKAKATYLYGDTVDLVTPSCTGYDFKGWFDSSTGKQVKTINSKNAKNYDLVAKWEPKAYTVIFNANPPENEITGKAEAVKGKTPNQKIKYNSGTNLTLNKSVIKGYKFYGWQVSKAAADAEAETFSPTPRFIDGATITTQLAELANSKNEVTLYGIWHRPSWYEVNLVKNGGTGDSYVNHYYGADTYLNNPTKTGYQFGGWYYDSEFKKALTYDKDAGKYKIQASEDSDMTIHAKWVANYSVKYDINLPAGTVASTKSKAMADQSMICGNAKALTKNSFVVDGYAFMGWSTTANGSVVYANGEKVLSPTLTGEAGTFELKLYAVWQKDFVITFDANGGNLGPMVTNTSNVGGPTIAISSNKITYQYGQSFKLPASGKTGYKFDGWYTDNGTFKVKAKDVTKTSTVGGVTYYAKWKENTYTISFNSNPPVVNNKKLSVKGSVKDIRCTTSQTITMPNCTYVIPGKEFAGWYLDANCSSSMGPLSGAGQVLWLISNADSRGKITLYAKWIDKPVYTLTFHTNGGSFASGESVTYDSETKTYAFDYNYTTTSTVSVPTPYKPGFVFGGWYQDKELKKAVKTPLAKGTALETDLYAKWIVVK